MSDVRLWIDPPSYHFEQDRLFDISKAPNSGDSILAPYLYLRSLLAEHGIPVHTADLLGRAPANGCRNLYVSTGITKRFRRLARRDDVIPSAFIAVEAPIVAQLMYSRLPEASRVFRRMFACNSGLAMTPFLKAPVSFEPLRYIYPFDSIDEQAWSRQQRSFLVMINANKAIPDNEYEFYSERLKIIEFFARKQEIDLYGVGWDGPPYVVIERRHLLPRTARRLTRRAAEWVSRLYPDPLLLAARSVWRGRVTAKSEVLSRYRFSICVENQLLEGWITEKIFDCMRAGCVPVYLGAPDVEQWVPRECFIDMRAFADYGELRDHLLSLGPPEIEAMREAGRDFLGSARFKPFSKQAFADVFLRILAEDAGVPIEATDRRTHPSMM